jgi:lipopolysaccharide/colanic/teichoic acid biosynthesis glycosyltransferase
MAGIPLYSPPRTKIKFIKNFFKRGFDIVGSIFALIFLSPLFILISLAIIIEDGFPIYFSQKRALVKGTNEFLFYKFRSMVKNAEALQDELYKINLTSGGLFRVEDDPRLTKVGKIIRKFSLDEIPQFYNVLIGDMSLVGPRPLSIADLGNIAPENTIGGYYKLRANAKPGITGLWQISGRRELSFKEMVLLDLYYIENQSIMFDLEILFETIPVVMFGKGAY